MKNIIAVFVVRNYLLNRVFLLCLMCSLVISACGTPATEPPARTDAPPTEAPVTLTPTLPPTPIPTTWPCTSYRSGKVQNGDIPGEVKIDTPLQGTIDLPSGQNIQAAGTYTGIPAGKYLWVFIYSPDAGLHGRYYPQTKDATQRWQPDPTTEPDGRWTLNVSFGAPQLCYEVIVMVADTTESQSIASQLQRWADLNNYAGYELNGPLSAEPPDGPGFPGGLVEKVSIEVRTR